MSRNIIFVKNTEMADCSGSDNLITEEQDLLIQGKHGSQQ
jgi:hypothetical protein